MSEDKMRGTSNYWAQLLSKNQPDLDFPYSGGSPITIQLVKSKGDPQLDNISPQLVLSRGQFDCHERGNSCSVSVKADNFPVQNIYAVSDDCGSDKCLTLYNDAAGKKADVSFIETIRATKHLTIEVPLFHFGTYQYEFDVDGLRWSKKTDRQ